jgi:predicted acetyltransferase
MEEIRVLLPDEQEESLQLSQFAFQFRLNDAEARERLEKAKQDETWGLFGSEGLEAKLTLLPLETFIGGSRISMGGIAGVATWPEKRRGGKVAKLLTHTLGVMRDRGQIISFLHPFQFEFYRKFGWETYIEYKNYELAPALIPRFPHEEGSRIVRTKDVGLLNAIYEKYASRFNGSLVRTVEWWEERILKRKNDGGISAVYYGADGTPKGYVLYKVTEQNLTVHEFVALDAEAYKGLWTFIANHDSMLGAQGYVKLRTERKDRLTTLLKNPRIKQEIVPYFMARLVDAAVFLEQYRFKPGVPGELRLYIRDEYAPWNEGLYVLQIGEDGTAKVTRSGEGAGTEEDGVVCGIGILTSMLLGYERPAFWLEHGMLGGSRAAALRLEEVMPERDTFLLDFF